MRSAQKALTMDRCLESEWLDELPASDAMAKQSRRDLRRLNWHMGNVGIVAGVLRSATERPLFREIIDLGAGDGDFLLKVARRLGSSWQGTKATLLDRETVVAPETVAAFRSVGWEASPSTCDVFDWCATSKKNERLLIVANLFLHHFEKSALAELLMGIEGRSSWLVALEPRRSRLALVFSKLVGVIGCNAVTRHDAPASVRAGFTGSELSALWPNRECWTTIERPAGAFGHLFIAKRKGGTGS